MPSGNKPFVSFWGVKLNIAELPQTAFEKGGLNDAALSVLAVLLDLEKSTAVVEKRRIKRRLGNLPLDWSHPAFCKVSQKTLAARTGYSDRIVKSALKKLRESGWIEPIPNRQAGRNKGGKFPCTTYTLTKPGSLLQGSFLPAALNRQVKGNVLWGNGLRYFTFPRAVLRETEQPWSVRKMASKETRLYFAFCYLANEARSLEFGISLRKLVKLTGMDIRTVFKRLIRLRELGLVWVDGLDGVTAENLKKAKDTSLNVQMCDPYTGQPLHTPLDDAEADDANYRYMVKRVSRRAYLNLPPEEVEKIIRELVDGPVRVQGNGDLQICCPFHPDSSPSLSVSLVKRGCWRCWGCPEKGDFSKLIMGLTGCTRVESMQRIGKAAAGQQVHYQRPDSDIIARYPYRDEYDTKTLKEVVRYPNREDGSKDIRQRQPAAGGWRWDVQGLGPMLYNVHRLRKDGDPDGTVYFPEMVVVCEGEKDADTVTAARLWALPTQSWGKPSPVIGVTSGGSNSWDASLAKELHGKRVIVMPDDDEPGAYYAAQVKASLEAEGIAYREVSFAGTGAKDVSEFVKTHALDELIEMIGSDWVRRGSEELETEQVANLLDPAVTGQITV